MPRFSNVISSFFARGFAISLLERNRFSWVDYLRGIAIILVVYRHALIGIERSGMIVPKALVDANMIFYSFRMPLFFIVSGIFIGGSLKRKRLSQVIEKKFETLFYPYLVWAFIQVTLQILLSGFVNSERSWFDYLYIIYQPRNLDQFWYLPALFNTTVIYIIVKVKLKPPQWLQLSAGVVLYFVSAHLTKISMLSDWMEFYLFFAIGDTIASLFFTDRIQKLLGSSKTLILIIPVFIITQVFYLRHYEYYYRDYFSGQLQFLAIALIGCFTMFVFAFCLQKWKIISWLRIFGYHSLYIYVMHVLVIAFMRIVMTKVLGVHNATILLFNGIFWGITLPVLFYNLFIKDKLFWFLFTYKKNKTGFITE